MTENSTYEAVAAATGIERVEVLHGHTSQATAYLIEDYPYGRQLSCQRRVWLEEATKGAHKGEYRFMAQTSNPKVGMAWNKPQASNYYRWAVLVRKPEKGDDFIDWSAISGWGPGPAADVRIHVSGIYGGLDDSERRLYDAMVALSRMADSEGWARWENEIMPGLAKWHAEHGAFPAAEDEMALGTYLPARDYPAACAAALLSAGGLIPTDEARTGERTS